MNTAWWHRFSAPTGYLARDNSRALRPDDAFRAASVTKSVTAAVAVRLACQGRLGLDEPLADQLAPGLLYRWSALDALPHSTPRQLLGHTSGLPDYFTDEAFGLGVCEKDGEDHARSGDLSPRSRGPVTLSPLGSGSSVVRM